MTTKQFQFGIRITADGRGAVSEAGKVEHAITGVGHAADQAARQAERAYAGVTRLAQVTGAAFSVHELAQAADVWTTVNAQLKLAAGSAQAGTEAYQNVVKTALDAGQSLADVGNVYRRFADNASVLGISQAQVAAATQTVAQAIALSGSSAEASQAALVQFGQGLASGALRGEELNSVLEQAPRLAKVLADGLGVPIGRLRELAEQGQITSDAIVKALAGQASKVAEEFGQMPVTMGRALTNLQTAFTDTVGSFEKSTGVFGGVAKGIDAVATHMDVLAATAGVVAAVYAGKTVAGLVAATQSKVAATAATRALIAAELQEAEAAAAQAAAKASSTAMMVSNKAATEALTAANGRLAAAQVAATAAGRGAMVIGALGGPLGIITTALTLGVTAWSLWAGNAEQASAEAAKSTVQNLDSVIAKIQEMNGRLGEVTRKSYDALVSTGGSELKTVRAQMEFLQGQLDKMDQQGGRGRFSEEGKAKQAELNALAGREITLQKELADARQKSADVGTAALNRFIDTNAVGAEKVRVKQTKLLQEFSQAIAATGGVYDASNEAHRRAYAALQAGLADEAKKGAEKGNNDFAQSIKARINIERDAAKAQIDIIKDRVAEREITEREGIERTLAAQQEGVVKEAALLKQQLAGTKDKGEREQLIADIQKLGTAAARAASDAERGFARLADVSLKTHQEYMRGIGDQTAAILEKAKVVELENERIGLTAEQLAELTARRYDEQIALKEQRRAQLENVSESEAEIFLIEQQIAALNRLKAAESARPLLESRARFWQDFNRDIERGLTDSIYRGLEKGGEDGAKVAKEAILNTLKAIPIKLAVQAMVTPVMSGIGQALGKPAGSASGGGNILDLAGSMGRGFGDFLPDSVKGFGSSFGPAAGAALTAFSAINALDNGKFGAAIGTGIGYFLGGPIGGAIGNFAGGLLDDAFGGGGEDPHDKPDQYAVKFGVARRGIFGTGAAEFGTFGPMWGLAGQTSGSGRWGDSWNLSDAQIQSMNRSVTALFDGMEQMAETAGFSTAAIDGLTVDLHKFGSYSAGLQALLADSLGEVSDAIAKAILPTIKDFQAEGETLGGTFARLMAEVAAVQDISEVLGQTFEATGEQAVALADGLANAMGGLANLQQSFAAYVQAFYSEEEQLALMRDAIADQLDAVGLALPADEAAFRDLVESIDRTTAGGQRAFAVLMQVAPAFSEMTEKAAAAIPAVGSLADQLARTQEAAVEAIEAQSRAAEEAAGNARQAADSYRQASVALADSIAQLRGGDLSPLSPQQKLDEKNQALSALYARAMAGDMDALSRLGGAANDYLSESRAFNASGTVYAGDFARVTDMLRQAGLASDTGALRSDYQATLLELQVESLDEIRAQLASPSPDATILAEQKAILATIDQALASQNSLTLTGNATADAIRYLTTANNSLSEGLLRSMVEAGSVQAVTLDGVLAATDQTVDLLQQLVELTGAKVAADAAATAESERAQAESTAVLNATAAYQAQKAVADAMRANWDQAVAAFGVRQDGTYTSENISAGRAAGYAYYTHYVGDDAKVGAAREANAAYLAAFSKAYELYQAIPGHATGLERVPYDDYLARLHQDETVVDAASMTAIRRYFGVTPRVSAPADNGKSLTELRRQNTSLEAIIRQQGAGMQAMISRLDAMHDELKTLRKTARRQEAAA